MTTDEEKGAEKPRPYKLRLGSLDHSQGGNSCLSNNMYYLCFGHNYVTAFSRVVAILC